MLYLYDNAICEDLSASIDSNNANSIVRSLSPDGVLGLIAEMKEDRIAFPLVCVIRDSDTPVDKERWNFSRLHFGVSQVYDPETKLIYNEKAMPISLNYTLNILATNTADIDEITREIVFKYTDMYFLSITAPYEAKDRKLRFGVSIDNDYGIKRESGNLEYIQGGKLYQSSIHLRCEGAVLLTYTPKHLPQVSEPTVEVK